MKKNILMYAFCITTFIGAITGGWYLVQLSGSWKPLAVCGLLVLTATMIEVMERGLQKGKH